jgi:hypothetical protein
MHDGRTKLAMNPGGVTAILCQTRTKRRVTVSYVTRKDPSVHPPYPRDQDNRRRIHRRSHDRCVAVGGLLFVLCGTTRAWNYEEHFAITYSSLTEACESAQSIGEQGNHRFPDAVDTNVLCSEAARICLAHMAALAGDYVKSPSALVDDAKTRKVLQRGNLDCTGFLTSAAVAAKVTVLPQTVQPVHKADGERSKKGVDPLPQCMAPEGEEWTPEIAFKLVRNPLRRGYRWVSLATRNAQHFQPASSISWRYYSSEATNNSKRYLPEERLAYQAFALHFLEDSFPAGHVGLDRPLDKSADPDPDVPLPPRMPGAREGSFLLGRSQDYAHAYHDDLNHAGQALKTPHPKPGESHWWFAYGDTQLCAPTLYLYVPPSGVPTSLEQGSAVLDSILTRVGANPVNSYQDQTFKTAAIDAINLAPTRSSDDPPVVLSLPRAGLTSFLQTSISSAVAASVGELFRQFSVCAWSQYCDKIEVVLTPEVLRGSAGRCDDGTPVPNAPGYIIYRCKESAGHVHRAAVAAQIAFLASFGPDPAAVQTAHFEATDAMPSEYSPNDPVKARGSSELNLEDKVLHYQEFQPIDHVEPRIYESWGPSLTYFNGTKLTESMLSFGPTLETEGCAACNVDLRIGVLSWHHAAVTAPLNTAITSFIYHPIPPKLGRVITGNLRLDAGFQGLWDGAQRRNVFAGAGLGVELPFGRYVFEATVMRDFHWNSDLHGVPTTTLSIGVRIPSVSLSKSPQGRDSSR